MDKLNQKMLNEIERIINQKDNEKLLILDAATGAGVCTRNLARIMKKGRIISVDIDPASWDEWALPKLREDGTDARVTFICDDLTNPKNLPTDKFDIIVSHTTISVLGFGVFDALWEFYQRLRDGGYLFILDNLPEQPAQNEMEMLGNWDWRLDKARFHLMGITNHYEEIPPEKVAGWLYKLGFSYCEYEIHLFRGMRSGESLEEWLKIKDNLTLILPDKELEKAILAACKRLAEHARREGIADFGGGNWLLHAQKMRI